MENDGSPSTAGNLLVTRVRVTTAVLASLAWQDLNRDGSLPSEKPPKLSIQYPETAGLVPAPVWPYQRSKFAHTAAASKVVPSENFTPSCRPKVQVSPSVLGS